jgi:hypothetical protein
MKQPRARSSSATANSTRNNRAAAPVEADAAALPTITTGVIMSNSSLTPTDDSIGPNDPTVRMHLPLCVRCQHEIANADMNLESTVELERLPALLRRQAE